MAKLDPEVLAHLEWLGFVQPTGLVVSAPALVRAGAILDRRDIEGQRLLRECVVEGDPPSILDFRTFAEKVLGWSFSPKAYAGTDENPIPTGLEIPMDGDVLRPDFAVRELEPSAGRSQWQLLVRVLDEGEDFDRVSRGEGRIEASEHGRMERLLRQTGVGAGLLFNGRELRLLSAPERETSGWLDFRVADMVHTAGRPIATAMRLLLREQRLLSLPRAQRLAALLDDSRKFQNEVSERLAEQVLHALYELLRGFQHANDQSKGALLRYTLADHPDEVYRGLLTVLLRLVFLLYAEERDMLPEDETFLRNYSIAGLYERLREDAALYPDTMEQRYGAWAQLLALFRMIHDGAEAGPMRLPKRHGVLFDPDSYPFLEGRFGGARQIHERIDPPLVPDGTIYRAMEKLLVLDGERISYRALDVEQIGSVYETMMGFRLERATGPSIAIKAQKKQGAPTSIDLEELLGQPGQKREKWIAERADRKLTDTLKKAVKGAQSLDELHAALSPIVDRYASPDLIPPGSMMLQPSEERRRSGSHYTPRSLTEPIVRTTLEPILKRLRGDDGRAPRPEQILDLKVCDPAMGSGAFLVEACRQLGEALVESWRAHDAMPKIPFDENEQIFARRLVAQRCLYGVDKNPMAVDLAKVSLWLITLAREHPLTFIDHALRHGDSLIGLSRKQIQSFHWNPTAPVFQEGFETMRVREHLVRISDLRNRIRNSDEDVSDSERRDLWHCVRSELAKLQVFGDLLVAAYLGSPNAKARETARRQAATAVADGRVDQYLEQSGAHSANASLDAMHWELEFPEVFERKPSGFDVIVGNPPFLGGTRLEPILGRPWRDYIVELIADNSTGTRGAGDLVAYFLLRAFELLRESGCLGLVTTNSISQGDTRVIGLGRVVEKGGEIYAADRSITWPGEAGIEIARVWITRGTASPERILDGLPVEHINSWLRAGPEDEPPKTLKENADIAFEGAKLIGEGFIIGEAEARSLIAEQPNASTAVLPFLSGHDVNSRPDASPSRWAINFWDWPLDRQSVPAEYTGPVAADFPECLRIVEERVKPFRFSKPPDSSGNRAMRERWWQFFLWRPGLYAAIRPLERVLVRSRVSNVHAFVFTSPRAVLPDLVIAFALDDWCSFSCLQSRIHDEWTRKHASTMRNDVRYTPTSCFQTFPFPKSWRAMSTLSSTGKQYFEFRASLMLAAKQGLTHIYNRFNDPDDRTPEISKLRELHAAVDRVVLSAYGWDDISTDCDFFLDYEIDEEDGATKKKPYRYRWPDEVRDEVLARLLELNGERAREEARSGGAAEKKSKAASKKKRGGTGELF